MLLLSAAVALLLGLCIILLLPLSAVLHVIGAIAWCAVLGVELLLMSSSHKRFSLLRVFADGRVELRDAHGGWKTGAMSHGCVVLKHLAWLDVALAGGGRYRTLLRGDARKSEQWRRLQVICRHLGPKPGSC